MNDPITLSQVREVLYSAVISDAFDSAGFHNQCFDSKATIRPMTGVPRLVGRCRTTLWEDIDFEDPEPYKLELQAVDNCQPDDVIIAAAGGSLRSGIWGELLTTASKNRGCVGVVTDGAVRDITAMRNMNFPVFAAGTSPFDSLNRQRVVACDETVEIGGVKINSGDLVFADEDGVVIIPQESEQEILRAAHEKVHAENEVRDAIRDGMGATAAFQKYGVL